ncbi:TetR/AcrR family transcriptional regulator [Serratia bockelmannii]|uniref:TetR/AcrR family transcriptional regulator n=1 Tax=Yersiniaceae TaxID=1903411 RepID=UPI001C26EF38|nr:TetR/AcrR family transcriptional regulator [Rahnella perminowiae]MBU9809444.1 TetR/AcrR family transcriptional regulator [Rahnella perminowiae]
MDKALGKAVRVFCERGYHATSISDLTSAMELASGSVYKAFKDKRAVFLAAFDHYKAERDTQLHNAIEQGKSGRERLHNALVFFAESSSGAQGQLGCLVISGAADLSTFDAEISQRVTGALTRSETMLKRLIIEGQADSSISSELNSQDVARLMLCVLQGMRVIGKTGRDKQDMKAVADAAMKCLR